MAEEMVNRGVRLHRFQVAQVSTSQLEIFLDCDPGGGADEARRIAREWIFREFGTEVGADVIFGRIATEKGRKSHYFQAMDAI
jgi:hypothetical protein